MNRVSVKDGEETFDVTLLEPAQPGRTVLFSVGGGGNPERHSLLLTCLADNGCAVVAPHFARLVSPIPTEAALSLRARRLRLALDRFAHPGLSVAGVGHSIGATMLLALAGGQVWMRSGERVVVEPDARIGRLALLAPATGFFQKPGALEAVSTPIVAWAGGNDTITPPAHAAFLQEALEARLSVKVHVVEGAGHFSFMNVLPPETTDPLPEREAFLAGLATEVSRFVTR